MTVVIFDLLLFPLPKVLGLCQNINLGERGLDYEFYFILLNNLILVVMVVFIKKTPTQQNQQNSLINQLQL